MIINKEKILKIYKSVLDGSMSYGYADNWAWEIMTTYDNGNLIFEPKKDEELLWELIQYLYGIDIPDMYDREKTARDSIDIKEFLISHNIFL